MFIYREEQAKGSDMPVDPNLEKHRRGHRVQTPEWSHRERSVVLRPALDTVHRPRGEQKTFGLLSMKKRDKMLGFAGFPAGKLPTTSVPNHFFSDLLPLIDNLAELKVTLHLFWMIGRKRGELRYARLDELLQDDLLIEGLSREGVDGRQSLLDGLERAVARGSLLHATVQRGDRAEEWYMVNSAHGRDVMERLNQGELDLMSQIAEDVQLQVERPTIFVLYEQNIGILTHDDCR